MRFVTADWESMYSSKDYTLKKLSTEEYIRDPRFEAHGVAIKWNPDTPARWYDERQARYILAQEDWSDVFMIHHHAQFDSLIESHHYNVHPRMIGCTLSMARLMLGNHLSVSLEQVRKHFGIPPKTTPYGAFDGKHWHELTPEVQAQMADGAIDEVESIWKIFCLFMQQGFPREELAVVDTTIKMFSQPVLRGDVNLLADIWEKENASKHERLAALNISAGELQSSTKFCDLLRAEGLDIEYKQGKNGPIPAIAKTDEFMRELLEDEDPRVRALAEARLGEKSTLMQTRAETLGFMAQRGPLCVYLKYCGTGTLRPSGGDGGNFLNMKRQSALRRTVMAPEGYLLGPIDSSQIEFRVGMYLAKQESVLDQLRRNEDPYVDIASEFYGEKIYKPAKDDPRRVEMEQKRGAGKQAKLMCQYGAAGLQFQKTAKAGLYGPPIKMSIEDADRFVQLYRNMHPQMCAKNYGLWAQCERIIARLAGGPPLDWNIFHVRDGKIFLPTGHPLNYMSLEFYVPTEDEQVRDFERSGYWRMRTRQGWKKMWGSKLVQNLCEAVSRVIVSQAMNRITGMGYRVLNWPYDELLLLIPKDGKEEQHMERCAIEMKRTPDWLPGIPLDAEWSLGERYSK
jgi:hypothetical protein